MAVDKREKIGKRMFKETYGDVLPLPKSTRLSDNSIRNFFGEVLPQIRLNARDRRLLILGALSGLGADPVLFEIHSRAAIANGEIKPEELDDMALLLQGYIGFPRLAPLTVVIGRVAADAKKAKGKKGKKAKAVKLG